ncbi:MAG TPA: formate dehydrogenase subunit alpha [Rubrobacter sp.]|nr:formate dehydrogenase subunit alpha [Rubrobacter sp.]
MDTARGTREVKSTCPYCGVGCGFVLRTQEGRLTGLRPDPDHPLSMGTLCPKGATAHQFIYHQERLARPHVRKDGRLVPVAWEEAYDFVAGELGRIREEHGPDAIGFIPSSRTTTEENYLAQKFARAVIGTNNVDSDFRICHSATAIGLKEILGSGAMTNSISELAEPGPETLLIVGSDTAHSHPVIWSVWIEKALGNGMKLIVVDPRTMKPARMADVHLKARPGTEVALFNAMAHYLIERGLYDEEFIASRCEGFAGLRRIIDRYTPEKVAHLCCVPAWQIERAAELYGGAERASIVYGLGVTQHRTGVDNVQALANLALITGNIGRAYTGLNALSGQNNVQGATDMCAPEWLPGYQSWDDPLVVAKFEEVYGAGLPEPDREPLFLSRMWERAISGELKALYVIGSDPALTEGHTQKVEEALRNLDLLVVQDVFPGRTTRLAHAVFPSASFAEKEGTFVNTERRVQLVRKAIEPVGESKPDWLILSELAGRMGYGGMDYASPEEVFEEIRRLVPIYGGMSYRRLEESSGLQWPCPDEDHPGTPILHVGSFARGKALLRGIEYLPPEELHDGEYPLLLTTGSTFMHHNAGIMTEKADPENVVQIGATDATKLGIEDGDEVRVSTRRGMLAVKAEISEIVRGVIWMPLHFPERPTNLLTNDALDPVCGITELKACAAKVEAVRPGNGAAEEFTRNETTRMEEVGR